MTREFVISRRSDLRLRAVEAFLGTVASSDEAVLLGADFESLAEVTRALGRPLFGWRRATLFRHALELARPALLAEGRAAATGLGLEALWARVTWELARAGQLGRLAPLSDRPGLSRALARTISELRQAGLSADAVEPALGAAMRAFEAALERAHLADRADVFALATQAVPASPRAPLALVDVPVGSGAEADFLTALAAHAPRVLAVAPDDDATSVAVLSAALGPPRRLRPSATDALGALQRHLFTNEAPAEPRPLEDLFSAPGEARECVEVARRIVELARQGVRFDDVAVLLRSPQAYRAPLEDALRRAGVPAHFASGLPRPDPAGRAFLALLRCAEERLSARRFNEYLSLAQVPKVDAAGAPPRVTPAFARPDAGETLLPLEAAAPSVGPAPDVVDDVEAPVVLGQLRAPRRWEQLIVDAAVIGGPDRWRRRLGGLRSRFEKERLNPTATEAQLARVERALADLDALERFALPVLDDLAALPARASWAGWLEALSALAARALKAPARVRSVLAELAPLGPVGPLELPEVRAVLSRRLAEVTEAPEGRRHGRVFVAPVEAARGASFHTVFVPGLAERIFPQKLHEDPLLSDRARAALSPRLETGDRRIETERLALLLAVGAARTRAVLSYPRVDVAHARPRVPSFYALEAARAVEGQLPAFEALARQAEARAGVRLAWPAPPRREDAIDDAEFDLATLSTLAGGSGPVRGRARYLVAANPHLARALRARYARWQTSALSSADGLVLPSALARAALEAHHPSRRPFSPTALEQYAACPYRFFLSAILRLEPHEVPAELEALGPLEKGSMAHEAQFRLLSALRRDGLEVTPATLDEVLRRLGVVVAQVAGEVYDEFKPAIERVWRDGVQTLEADLREWLQRTSRDAEWRPAHYELAFGLPGRDVDAQDPASTPAPVTLAEGLTVRGSIDLVERHRGTGALRATDYKTGRARAEPGNVIGGGRHLQPVLYALVLEQLFRGEPVWGGRLYYTTQVGGYEERPTPLDALSRAAFGQVARALREALETGFFPAAPDEGECAWCAFQAVCGPDEERRLHQTRKGLRRELSALRALRQQP
ncbi:MAG: PD-(D/E)XK nuclease family protein [Myxococcaceae bacterium]|nr:PD-(D/E)XK nuclease family protein [Myxococcaceae bacterium]MCA3014752.1 PD-(D/E)XK nuclease family protein [Myxococcaceae bacterium]